MSSSDRGFQFSSRLSLAYLKLLSGSRNMEMYVNKNLNKMKLESDVFGLVTGDKIAKI